MPSATKFGIPALVACVITLQCLAGGSVLTSYALQEKCMSTAANQFKQGYGTGKFKVDGQDQIATYQNHYNTKLAKCIVILNVIASQVRAKRKTSSVTIDLWDILENRLIGSFFSNNSEVETTQCFVEQKLCSTKEEWEALIHPFMND